MVEVSLEEIFRLTVAVHEFVNAMNGPAFFCHGIIMAEVSLEEIFRLTVAVHEFVNAMNGPAFLKIIWWNKVREV